MSFYRRTFQIIKDAWRQPDEDVPDAEGAHDAADEATTGRAISGLWNLTKHNRKPLAPAVIFLLLSTCATAALPMFPRFAIDVIVPRQDFATLYLMIGLFIVSALFAETVHFLGDCFFMKFQRDSLLQLQKRVIGKILALPAEYYQHKSSAYRVSLLQNQLSQMEMFFSGVFVRYVGGLMLALASVALMLYLNWKLAIAALVLIPIIAFISGKLGGRLHHAANHLWRKSAEATARMQQSIRGIITVKSLAGEKQEAEQQYKLIDKSIMAKCATFLIIWLDSLFGRVFGRVAMAAVLGFGLSEVMSVRLSLGSFVAFIGYMSFAIGSIEILPAIKSMLIPTVAASRKIFYLLDMIGEEQKDEGKMVIDELDGGIVLENVSFSYDREVDILKNVSFTIDPRRKIAIVGKTGAGKSTLLLLLLGLFKPTGGRILFGGHDIKSINLNSIRKRIGFVSQDVFLFDDTIGENITYGKPDASQAEIAKSISHAGLTSFVNNLPEGLQTKVGEDGVEVSGGEKQRIALARAILKTPDVLILDEPMSAVDSGTEAAIKAALDTEFAQTTTIMVSHRLATIKSANHVMVLDAGKIVQEGSPGELIASPGPFQSLFRDQLHAT